MLASKHERIVVPPASRKTGRHGYIWYYEDTYLKSSMGWCIFCNQKRHFEVISVDDPPKTDGKCWFEDVILEIIAESKHLWPADTHWCCVPGGSNDHAKNVQRVESQLCHLKSVGDTHITSIQIHDTRLKWRTVEEPLSGKSLPVEFADRSIQQRLETAAQWVRHCKDIHLKCWSTQQQSGVMPKRLLDVKNASSGSIRLIDSGEADSLYAALSYCWGASAPLVSLTSNIGLHRDGIRVQDLPQTVQDAVEVCSVLEIRYLWVDSLCIVQDDPLDWSVEAEKMCSVYENAYITIAATVAEHSNEGFLQAQSKHRLRLFPMPEFECHRLEIPTGNITAIQAHSAEFKHEALHRRAWCFQEWMLSRRILSFRQEEIQYLCLEDQKCDCYFAHEGTQSTGMMQLFRNALEAGDQRKLHDEWFSMVEDFKSRQLTQTSDRIPALAGLAVKFQEFWPKARYLCGIWSNDFLDGLAWCSRLVKTSKPNPCYPSWSWASIETKTQFDRSRKNEYVTQISDDAVPLTAFLRKELVPQQDSTNQYIQLHGQLKAMPFRYDPGDCKGRIDPTASALQSTKQPDRKRFYQVEIDSALELGRQTLEESASINKHDAQPIISRTTWKENHTDPFESIVYCLRLSTDQIRGNEPMSLCLLLTRIGEMDLPLANFIFPVQGEVPGSLTSILKPKQVPVFRRIGYVMLDVQKTWENVKRQCVFIV